VRTATATQLSRALCCAAQDKCELRLNRALRRAALGIRELRLRPSQALRCAAQESVSRDCDWAELRAAPLNKIANCDCD